MTEAVIRSASVVLKFIYILFEMQIELNVAEAGDSSAKSRTAETPQGEA